MRISSNTLCRLLVQPPSVPSATGIPRVNMPVSGAMPSPRNAFADGLWTTLAPRSEISARSSSSTQTQCTRTARSFNTPMRSSSFTGDRPWRSSDISRS